MCLNPQYIRSKAVDAKPGARQLVRCGKCLECLRENQREWIYRLEKEQQTSKHSLFMTFTYSPANVPLIDCETREIKSYADWCKTKHFKPVEYSINPKDAQNYWKRVREKLNSLPLKHYTCMEYGDKFDRPHMHSAIFYDDADPSFVESVLSDKWQKGYMEFEPLCDARIAYVTKYLKKGDDEAAPTEFSLPPQSRKSHGFGLKGFLIDEQRHVDYYNACSLYAEITGDYADFPKEKIPHVTTSDGCKLAVPRYFRRKLFEHEDFLTEKIIEDEDRRFRKQKDLEARTLQDLRVKGYHWDSSEVWPSMAPNFDFDRIKRDVYTANLRRKGK